MKYNFNKNLGHEENLEISNEELKQQMVERYLPMNSDEQELFFFMLVDSYFELLNRYENGKYDNKQVILTQLETYSMLINLFNKPAKELEKIGYDPKHILRSYVKKQRDKYFEEIKQA